ncbi:MAG TPA: 50S ribosomal protein L10 [archaeon]|nr:50S ribosomal protein L10 [archaeon]HPC10021.1 50S ribosomal protein L10 [archaeon]HRT02375.1 50S ribosomal protein L10 [Candidatus Diapherotrites archaeon]
MNTHTKLWRVKQLEELNKLVSKYNVIGIGSVYNFPASLLHKLKKNLPDVVFKVTNKNVLKKVLESNGHNDLVNILPSQPILILANNLNAFEVYSKIKKNKAKSRAKVGMISPIDIIVPAGDTGLPPGPALSDLKKVGLKAQVKGQTISIVEDSVIVKKGNVINSDVVSTLSKLGIKPIELILDVVGIKEGNLIYPKDALDINAEDIFNKIILAIRSSVNLGVEIEYPTSMTINPMISKAYLQAQAISKLIEEKNV